MKIPPLVGLFLAIATLDIGLTGWLRANMLAGQTELRTRMDRLEIGQNELRERMARLEGALSGLLARPAAAAAPPKADAPQ